MSKNIQTLAKWMPPQINLYEQLFMDCSTLKSRCNCLTSRICEFINQLNAIKHYKYTHPFENNLNIQEFEELHDNIENVVSKFNTLYSNLKLEGVHIAINRKFKKCRFDIWKVKHKLCYILQELIALVSHLYVYYGDTTLTVTLKICKSYNALLALDSKLSISTSVCNNTCPYLMFPLHKYSITRLLQILAYNRAEICCHKLIDCLLETYTMYENSETEDYNSDNSSLEIYMALTKHMSPPAMVENCKKEKTMDDLEYKLGFLNLEELILYEENNVLNLLKVAVKVAPAMLGNDGIKKSKNGEKQKIFMRAQEKVLDYYEQILWAEVGNYLEHVILWWAASPLSERPPHSSQHLREWINQFIPTADIPSAVTSALISLVDSLGVHITSTSWDNHFRLALVSSTGPYNFETGKLFGDVLQDLVMLCNQCEVTCDWIMGAPLNELPLVEQIPVLHRLDHSIHMCRLWAVGECKKIANIWNVNAFFSITQKDILTCLNYLDGLTLNDHSIEIEKGQLGVHVEVCSLMRAKLASEVKVNRDKLKDTPKECVECLASICRTICLANLQMIFPSHNYWSENRDMNPANACHYVEKYLKQILMPVLVATDDPAICNMILTLVCESWLNHIYIHKIKFSQFGANQLLRDFGHVSKWLSDLSSIKESTRKELLKNEILKRCEGVGKLLLRSPGERLKMVDKTSRRKSRGNDASTTSEKTGQMPAEMYVPNQEQWLELRAQKKTNKFPNTICCDIDIL